MSDTAHRAGGESIGSQWAAARAAEVRLQCLLTHRRRLRSRGLSTLTDQIAAARRTWQELMGLMIERQRVESCCWRDRQAEETQMELTMGSLSKSLSKAKAKTEKLRLVAYSQLAPSQYWRVIEEIRIQTAVTRKGSLAWSFRNVKY